MCTVHHVVGSVHACSNESDLSIAASKRGSLREIDASAAKPWPRAASPTVKWRSDGPVAATWAAQSLPGGPGSPGYAPRTLSTSRKLSPTARTCSLTSPLAGADGSSSCATKRRLLMAPRASK
eukprot:scaffold250610_cov30-Tisochrysis_lutea.AAC.8